jgi:hypothetical protein
MDFSFCLEFFGVFCFPMFSSCSISCVSFGVLIKWKGALNISGELNCKDKDLVFGCWKLLVKLKLY